MEARVRELVIAALGGALFALVLLTATGKLP